MTGSSSLHLIPMKNGEGSAPWQSNASTHTESRELLGKVPHHLTYRAKVEALLAFVYDDDPPVDGDRPVELLVHHVPSPVTWHLQGSCQKCLRYNYGPREQHTIVGWRLSGPYLSVGGSSTRAAISSTSASGLMCIPNCCMVGSRIKRWLDIELEGMHRPGYIPTGCS